LCAKPQTFIKQNGRLLDEVEHEAHIRVVAALLPGNELSVGPSGLERDMAIKAGTVLGLLASPQHLTSFVERNGLELSADLKTFAEILSPARAGIAEVVIPPGSHLIGKSAHEIWMRKTYGIAMLALHRGGKTLLEGDGIRDIPLCRPATPWWCTLPGTPSPGWRQTTIS
jgi:hypothetical protein